MCLGANLRMVCQAVDSAACPTHRCFVRKPGDATCSCSCYSVRKRGNGLRPGSAVMQGALICLLQRAGHCPDTSALSSGALQQ